MEVWNIWHCNYLLAGVIKAATAAISVATAIRLVPLVPQAVAVPNLIHLQEKNRQLEKEIAERRRVDPTHKPKVTRAALATSMAVGLPMLVLLSAGRKDYPDL